MNSNPQIKKFKIIKKTATVEPQTATVEPQTATLEPQTATVEPQTARPLADIIVILNIMKKYHQGEMME